jgi:hypothetical protein
MKNTNINYNIDNFLIKNKSLLIILIFILILIILRYIYNSKKNIKKPNNDKTIIKNKINNVIKTGEAFMNITLHKLKLPDNKTYENDDNILEDLNLTDNDKTIITNYNNFFNESTRNNINDWVTTNNNLTDENIKQMISLYNNYNNKVEGILKEINTDLLKQIQKNYATAHKMNIERQINMDNIDYLPQRFD